MSERRVNEEVGEGWMGECVKRAASDRRGGEGRGREGEEGEGREREGMGGDGRERSWKVACEFMQSSESHTWKRAMRAARS